MKRKRFVKLAEVGQIPPGQMKVVKAHGHEVVVVNLGDSYVAFNARCPHKGGPLGEGTLCEETIQCPWHHHRYDVRTGQNVYPKNVYPSDMPWLLDQVGFLQMYAVRVEGRDILLQEPGGPGSLSPGDETAEDAGKRKEENGV
ncbi:MAG: Rieske 2Fe-2S domain-containing protein [candidate division NC10 bacterium]|jgi:nitrite reductase/ring-hydroxylating ferredoxin subunit|nr:Rieske 2Fe-2S domain-containing protein [candidate division NC10 bacterium]